MRFPLKLVADYIVNPSSYLQGGRIYGRTYLIPIIEADDIVAVYEGQLRNNFRSQRSPAHQEGKQRPDFGEKYYVHREITKQNAVIVKKPSQDSEQISGNRVCIMIVQPIYSRIEDNSDSARPEIFPAAFTLSGFAST